MAVVQACKRPALDGAEVKVIATQHARAQGQGVGVAGQLLVEQDRPAIRLDQQVALGLEAAVADAQVAGQPARPAIVEQRMSRGLPSVAVEFATVLKRVTAVEVA